MTDTTSCPFCGAPGQYVTADEGTSYFDPRPVVFTDEEVPRDIVAQVDEWIALTDPPEIAASNVRGFAVWLDLRRKHTRPAPDTALREAAQDWLDRFAAYRTDCLSHKIWRESDEFIWDSTGPLRAALEAKR